jgi:hypothetical protein
MRSFLCPRYRVVEKDFFVDWDAQGLQETDPFPAPRPDGVTRRNKPPPSKSFWGFLPGLMVLTLVTVSGAIRLGMGFPFILGAFAFRKAPKPMVFTLPH